MTKPGVPTPVTYRQTRIPALLLYGRVTMRMAPITLGTSHAAPMYPRWLGHLLRARVLVQMVTISTAPETHPRSVVCQVSYPYGWEKLKPVRMATEADTQHRTHQTLDDQRVLVGKRVGHVVERGENRESPQLPVTEGFDESRGKRNNSEMSAMCRCRLACNILVLLPCLT